MLQHQVDIFILRGKHREYGCQYTVFMQHWERCGGESGWHRLIACSQSWPASRGGSSTLLMAEAYPRSTFIGYDFHAHSIEHAREEAERAGLDNLRFEVASAKDFPGHNYDLITFFDCLHDMGDPAGAARHVKQALHPDGTWMIVEPRAGDTLEDNLNPVGRAYYAFSTVVCTPTSLNQEVGTALGAQAGDKRLKAIVRGAGFSHCRKAAETAFNVVLEGKL